MKSMLQSGAVSLMTVLCRSMYQSAGKNRCPKEALCSSASFTSCGKPSLHNLIIEPQCEANCAFQIAGILLAFSSYGWFKYVHRISKRGTLLRRLRLFEMNCVLTNCLHDAYL
jgi:hypothetical protein